MPAGVKKLAYAHQFFSGDDLLHFYLPYTLRHAAWKKPYEALNNTLNELRDLKGRLVDGRAYEFPDKGYVNYLKSLLPGKLEGLAEGSGDACTVDDLDDRLKVVEDILQIDREQPEALLFIESAQYLNPYEPCRERVMQAMEANEGDYVQLFPGQPRPLLWFGDEEHLTQFGATAASIETALILAGRMDTPVNEQQLDFYRQFVFESYDLDIRQDSLQIALLPAESALAEELVFNWTVTWNGEEVFTNSETGQTAIAVPLAGDAVEYFIRVVIHDQDGRYYLRGGFDLSELPGGSGGTG